jgi:two-component system, NtrC family, response regulator HydG
MATAISRVSEHSHELPSLKVYILDDDLEFALGVEGAVKHFGHSPIISSDPQVLLDGVRRKRCEVAIADIRMPAMDGLDFLAEVQEIDSQIPVVLMTGFYSIDSAIEAIKRGAHDYLQKPFSIARLGAVLDSVANREQRSSGDGLGCNTEELHSYGIVGQSKPLLATFDLAKRVAPHFENVLLTGATGTGKEVLAKAIHRMSMPVEAPISIFNCSTLVETLAESHLFGHERGAFTGATEARRGLFEAAGGGTVILDEIGEVPLAMQAKLLRVVQNREVQRLGSTEIRQVDFRLIAATNRDLKSDVRAGRFREDLYYRLSGVELHLPPLAERMEDISALLNHFCEVYSRRYTKRVRGVSREAQVLLKRYHWPGNVRELENVISYGCMMAANELIQVRDLPTNIDFLTGEQGSRNQAPWTLDEMCERYVKDTMKRFGGDVTRTARALNIGKTTVYRYVKRGQVE